MKPFRCRPARRFRGVVDLPGDKSIAHRSIIISAIAEGKTVIGNFPLNQDCLRTLNAFRALGIRITIKHPAAARSKAAEITVTGKGLTGLRRPGRQIFAGESGTTFRLMLGILAGQDFKSVLTASESLSHRPMSRVTIPLRMMGAAIKARIPASREATEEYPPVRIKGGNLKGITYRMPVASAQVKSAILLAGLFAQGRTCVIDPFNTRDHTERMLKLFKAGLKSLKNKTVIENGQELSSPGKIRIPGDISSAGFFIVPAIILPDSEVLIRGAGLNTTRTGLLKVLKRMGANLKFSGRPTGFEPCGDIIARSSSLKGTVVRRGEIPLLIDELPVLMVAACFARGKTVLEGVAELRIKETDRVRSMCRNLAGMGADIQVRRSAGRENIIIKGTKVLNGSRVMSYGDHRTAMSMVVAGLAAQGETLIDDISCISKSFPDFLRVFRPLIS